MIKRVFDIMASGLGLLVLSPLLLVVAVLVKVTSRGPVLFTGNAVGRGFRPFRIYKFRSMVQDAPSKGWADHVRAGSANHDDWPDSAKDEDRRVSAVAECPAGVI